MEDRENNVELEKTETLTEGTETPPEAAQVSGQEMVDGAQEEKPKKKTGLIVGIAAAAVLLAAGCIFAFVRLTEKDPKEIVIAAFENVYSDDQVNPMEELFGLSLFAENAASADVETGMTIRLDSCSDESIQSFAGSGIQVTGSYDRTNKKSSANIGITYKDMDFLNVNAYYGEETLMAEIPELSSKVFFIDLGEGLGERLQSSPMLGPVIEEEGIDVKGLAEYFQELAAEAEAGETSSLDLKGLMNRYQEGTKAQESFKAAMTVEKVKGKFTVGSQEADCKGYLVHISKDSMIEFLRTSADFFLNDEELKDLFLKQLQQNVTMTELLSGTTWHVSAEDQYKAVMDNTKDDVNEMIDFLDETLNDVTMTVYVDKKGNLAAVNGSTFLTAESEEDNIQVSFEVNLEGGTYPTQNMKAELSLEREDNDKITINLTKQGTYDGNRLTDDISVDFKMEGKDELSLGLIYTDTYQADSGDFHIGISVTADGYLGADISMTGVVTQLEKGKSIHIDMDELKIVLMNQTTRLTLSGEYFYDQLSEEITQPEGELFDVVAADEEAWQNVFMEIFFQAMKLTNALGIE